MHSSRMHTVAISRRVCLSACWDTPPGVGLETPQVWALRKLFVQKTKAKEKNLVVKNFGWFIFLSLTLTPF